MIRGGLVYSTEEKTVVKKNLKRAVTATAFFMLLFFALIFVYDFILLYGVNIIFNKEFIFSRSYLTKAVKFFYGFAPHMDMIENSLIQILSLITSTLIIKAIYKIKISDVFRRDESVTLPRDAKHRITRGIKLFAIVYTINVVCSLVVMLIEMAFNKSGISVPDVDFSFSKNNASTIIIYFLATIVIAPIIEEFIFRGLILKLLKPYGLWFSVIITSMMFAIMHGNIPQGIGAFFIGMILAIVTIKTGSVVPAIFLHAMNNLIPFIGTVLKNTSKGLSNIFGMMLWIVLIGGVLCIYKLSADFSLEKRGSKTLSVKECMTVFFTSIPVLIYLAYQLYRIITPFIRLNR